MVVLGSKGIDTSGGVELEIFVSKMCVIFALCFIRSDFGKGHCKNRVFPKNTSKPDL
jgi:hypothetical protein